MQSDPEDERSAMPGGGEGLSADPRGNDGDSDPSQASPPPPKMPEPPRMPSPAGQSARGGQAAPPPPKMPPPPHQSTPTEPVPAVTADAPDDLGEMRPRRSDAEVDVRPDGQGDAGVAGTDEHDERVDTAPVAVTPSVASPAVAAAAPDEGDWLDRICPYLLSEDGSYRSTQPDESHRCTAQDPPGTLPLAFQERFCLSDQHVRCEMFKYAQSVRAAALEGGGVPAEQVRSAKFKPSVRSVPLALGTSGSDGEGGRSSRNILIGAAALGGAVLFILVVILLSGGGGGSVPDGSASPGPGATTAATPAVTPGPTPVATSDDSASPGPEATPAEGPDSQLIQYEVQEGEALLKIAEHFGTTRQRIIRANEGMADKTPYTEPGDIILVPAAADITIEELESFPGYVGPAE